jgi:vitamin B12 transporter
MRISFAIGPWLVGAAVGSSVVGAARPVMAQEPGERRVEEIIVTSSIVPVPRRQIGAAVSVIEAEEMQLRGYEGLADALRTQAGVSVANAGGPGKTTALRIRGEEGYRTLVMIDGVKALDPSSTQAQPAFDSLLLTNDLQRVEILRGPQGFIYGADAGGVVNVFTRTGKGEPVGQIGFEGGAFGLRKLDASVAGGSDKGDYFLAVTDLSTDGFNAQTADTVLVDDDGAENTTLHAKLGWNPTENLRLQLVARDIDAEAMFDDCYLPVTFENVHDCLATTDQTTYKVSADLRAGAFSHAFGYSEVRVARDSLAGGASAFASEGEISRLEYTGSFRPSSSLALVYGFDLQSEKMASEGSSLQRNQDGYYVEYQGAFAERFYVSLGARYDDNEHFGSHTSTRASFAYVQDLSRDRTLKYRASYGTGFRAPSLYEIAYNRGPSAFPPAAGFPLVEESSDGFDVGVEYDAGNGLHVEVTYFDQRIDDAIYFDLDTFSGYLQAPGKSTSKGVEVAVEAPLGDRWQLIANWTHNDTTTLANTPRLQRPENLANLGLLYRSANEALGLAINYRMSRDALGRDTFAMVDVPLDDYEVLDLSLSYAINSRMEVTGRIENALDEDYQEIIGFNTAGRAAYAGLKIRF